MIPASVRELRRAQWASRAARRDESVPAERTPSPIAQRSRFAPPGYRHWLSGLLVSMRP